MKLNESRILVVLAMLLLVACSSQPIKDYTDRSVYYSWVDISDIAGNRMTGFQIRNAYGPANKAIYDIGYQQLGGGYLVWHQGLTPAQYEYSKMFAMSCVGILCSRVVKEYGFGRRGSAIASVSIDRPGVVFAGCYSFNKTKTGILGAGEFETLRAPCGVSNRKMLRHMHKNATDALVRQRIQSAISRE